MTKGIKVNSRPIFCFGSNLAGIHGAGAALHARKFYGAKIGVSVGPTGRAYAIPTKDENIQSLPLDVIEGHVADFMRYAEDNPALSFGLVPIGTGLAGYSRLQMMQLVTSFDIPDNVFFTKQWFTKYRVDRNVGMT